MNRSYAQAVSSFDGRAGTSSSSRATSSTRGSTSDTNSLTKSIRQFASNVVGAGRSSGYTLLPSSEDPDQQGRERSTSAFSDTTETGDIAGNANTQHRASGRDHRHSGHSQQPFGGSRHSHHTHSHYSNYSQPRFSYQSNRPGPSHFSQYSRPSLIRRPTSTFVVGMEESPTGPTVLEMKTAVVQSALDKGGMGRYQWCIFFLCGFGYALDLMWAQALSLVTPRIQQELGISDDQYGDIFSVFSAGLTAGAFVWGVLVDIIGRKWAFNLTVGIVAVFGIVLGALDNWTGLCAITFFIGFGLGGNIPIDATIVLEFLPNDRRYLLAALSVFQPVGVVITSLLSWALIPKYACTPGLPACSKLGPGIAISDETCCTKSSNYGWRYALFTIGGLSVLAFIARFGLFTFEESPKFLVGKGKDQEAVDVINRVRAFNDKRQSGSMVRAFAVFQSGSRTDNIHADADDDADSLSINELEACEKEWEERERQRESFEAAQCRECGEVDGLPPVQPENSSEDSTKAKGKGGVHVKTREDEVTGSTEDVDDIEARPANRLRGAEVKIKGAKKYLGHLSALFSSWGMARLTILTWVCYAADYWGFTIAGNFLPKFLADRGAAANESTYVTYRNYIIIAVVGVPGVLLGAALIEIPSFGRKWAMVSSSALMGVSLFLYATITTPAASVGFNAMEYFFQSTFNAVLYGWTPEAFPAAVRGSACGLASFWGRLSSIIAPLAAAHLGDSTGVLYLAGGGVLLCTITALFLPDTKETDVL